MKSLNLVQLSLCWCKLETPGILLQHPHSTLKCTIDKTRSNERHNTIEIYTK